MGWVCAKLRPPCSCREALRANVRVSVSQVRHGSAVIERLAEADNLLVVGSELDLVDRQKGDVEIARHGFDGANPESRILRLDLLFAGDQRDRILSHAIGDLVVHLTREQPQRQADHAGGMGQHALDGEMGLAGIGGTQHRRDAGTAGA